MLTHDALHDKADYTPYEGLRIKGWPVTTPSRGEVVWAEGAVRAAPGRGAFVARERASFAAPDPGGNRV